MKKTFFVILILLISAALSANAHAAGLDDIENAIPDEAREIIGEGGDSALEHIISFGADKAREIFAGSLRTGAAVLLIPVLCSIGSAVNDDKLPDAVTAAGTLAIASLCLGGSESFIGLGRETLDKLDAFAKVLLPAVTAVTGASGAVTSAAAKYAAAALFIDLLMNIAGTLIVPLIYAYIAASMGSAVFGGGLDAAARLTKWAAVTAMTFLVLAFTLYISITGLITGSADQAAVKLTKTAISMSLPVVGGMISDAAGAVVNGTVMLRNSTGVLGMTAVLAICLVPFLRLGISHLVFKAAAALCEPIGGEKLSKVISAMGTAMGLMLGLCGAMAVMMYIAVISMMKVVT